MISDRGASSMTVVTLSLDELRQAAWVGVARTLRAINKARREPHGHPVERGEWEISIHGAAAEMAVAKTLGLYWGDDRKLDYGGDVCSYHVRSTDLSDGHLLLYERDPDDAYFVLVVTAGMPTFLIPGFIQACDGKRADYADAGRLRSPGWMVPQEALRPVEELLRW